MIFPPLLTETELQALYQRARSAAADTSLQILLEQRQAGDIASRYRGAGRLNLQGLDGVQRFTDVDTPELAVLLPHGMGA